MAIYETFMQKMSQFYEEVNSMSRNSKWYEINAAEQELKLLRIHRQLSRKKKFLKRAEVAGDGDTRRAPDIIAW